ncbi:hypothetical protein [Shimia sp.]|uniref:hypothetical protein n=1 Tax=Shimia sp. TaxID=1954381 RepID=UPI003B8B7AC2
MKRSPRTAFGLLATTVAMKAKAGMLQPENICHLMEQCLLDVGDDAPALAATLRFVSRYKANPISAGTALQDFILDWTDDIDPRRPSEALDHLERERKTECWRYRADLQ